MGSRMIRGLGRPPTITAKQVEEVLVATLESTPENATHWSRAKMAERSGLSESTIGRIWRAFGLQPHRTDTFKLSNDPLFVEKVYDIVGLYLNPPEAAVVLSVDEKSQVQALARSQPAFPMMPGMCERRTHDYLRHGTTSLFAAFDIADGSVISSLHRRHRTIEFKKFLTKIDSEVPEHLDVHLVCDNYGTHKSPAILRWLEQHPRFHMHYTPTYSSWINQVERWFAYLTDDLLRRSDHRSVQALEKDIRNWVTAWNENPKPFIWTKTAEQILESLSRLLQRINGAGTLACHGRGGLVSVQDAAIELADQRITALELAALPNLTARSCVLSACQTAVAEFNEQPDEAMSVSTALVAAGSACVIASLWSVDDAATAILMTRAYEEMVLSNERPPEALRKAQLWLRDLNPEDEQRFLAAHPALEQECRRRLQAGELVGRRGTGAPNTDRPYNHPDLWAPFIATGA